MDWLDYIEFDPSEIADRFGEDALEALQEEVEGLIEELFSAFDYADSEEETELAEDAIDDFEFTESEALSFAEDFVMQDLLEYMQTTGSRKEDMDRINLYLELTGQGK